MSDVPTAIRLDLEAQRLEIDWADGQRSRYAAAYLRQICPCAACRGHAPGEVEPPRFAQVAGVRFTGAEPVGRYALRFDLDDGHASGIYTFAWLRAQSPADREDLDDEGRPRADARG